MKTNIRINANLEELATLRHHIIEFAKTNKINDLNTELIVLSIDEICTNLIKYAYTNNVNNKIIIVTLELLSNKLTITIQDTTKPFDIRNHKDSRNNTKKITPGGLGIHIVKMTMDEIDYQQKTENNPLNILTLIKYL
ncbi:MAG: ATP-binding protein [Bacteroidetes bacterium]|nr:ATP-binding protein [Bacteroidota bacterium]